MAFTLRSNSENAISGSNTTFTIAKPSGLAVGDLMVAVIGKDDDPLADGPADWTIIARNGTTPGKDTGSWLGYKVADSDDVAESVFTWNADQERWSGTITAFIPGNANPAFEGVSTFVHRVNDATPESNSLATTSGNLVIGGVTASQGESGGMGSATGGYTLGGNPISGTAAGDSASILAYDLSGPGGTITYEANQVQSVSESHPYIIEFSDESSGQDITPSLAQQLITSFDPVVVTPNTIPDLLGSVAQGSGSATTTITASHTLLSGNNRRVFILIGCEEGGTGDPTLTVTYDNLGTPLTATLVTDGTQTAKARHVTTNQNTGWIYEVLESALASRGGGSAYEVEVVASSTLNDLSVHVIAVENAVQSANVHKVVIDVAQVSTGSPTAVNITTSVVETLILDIESDSHASAATSPTETGQVELGTSIQPSDGTRSISYKEFPGSGAETMGWSSAGTPSRWAFCVMALEGTGVSPDQDVSLALKTQLVSGFDPTLTPGPVDITPALLQRLVTSFDPAIGVGSVDMTPALVQKLIAAFNPSLTTGSVDITPELAQELINTFDLTLAVSAVNIDPELVQQLITAFDSTLTPGSVSISPALISQLIITFLPQLDLVLHPDLVQKLLTAIDPTLTYEAFIATELVQQLVVTYDPVVAPGAVFITPALLQTLLTGVDPTISGGIVIFPDVANQLILAYDPIVALGAGPTQDITPAIMQQLTIAHDPSVAPGSVAITPELLQTLMGAYGVTVGGDDQPGATTTMSDWSG